MHDYCGFRFLLASVLYSVHGIYGNSVDILTACILGMLFDHCLTFVECFGTKGMFSLVTIPRNMEHSIDATEGADVKRVPATVIDNVLTGV